MLVFLDESEFISWHGTDLHVQSYRVKIYFSFWNDQEWRMCDQPENFKCYGHEGCLSVFDQEVRNYIRHSEYL